jgi:3-oxoacyl-[acyl-carrier-protein] synthase-3
VTTLDLAETAARRLLDKAGVSVAEIDAIVFVTQTPDHWQPCNANLLHGRMGFPKSTAAFDINQGCSGWVYGCHVAFSMAEAGGWQRVLLLAGDTVSQTIHPRDRSTVILFGDAGTATLIERGDDIRRSWFTLHSDGTGHDAIKIPAGGHRLPSSPETSVELVDAEGNVRTPDHLHMNGLEVLNFTLREEPAAIRELLSYAQTPMETVDYFVFHQANKFIIGNLVKRLGLPPGKVPMTTSLRFGNQSSASIPAVLCDALADSLRTGERTVVMSGFGVGLSWASCLLKVGPLRVCDLNVFAPAPS